MRPGCRHTWVAAPDRSTVYFNRRGTDYAGDVMTASFAGNNVVLCRCKTRTARSFIGLGP